METLLLDLMNARDRQLHDAVESGRVGLWHFIRKRMPTPEDAEDILQEVLYELVASYRLPIPIEQAGAWMFRVARNRITDWFRRNRSRETAGAAVPPGDDDDAQTILDLLPSRDAGPEAAYARRVLIERLLDALGDLPPEQRWVVVAHEVEGMSFKAMAEETGVGVSTLLSRKRYAVLRLRRELQDVFDELKSREGGST